MSKETWLDTMDEIMSLSYAEPMNAGAAQTVIKGLSKYSEAMAVERDTAKLKNDQWFESYRRQCEETQKWIERVNIIEKSTLIQRLKFLFTKTLA